MKDPNRQQGATALAPAVQLGLAIVVAGSLVLFSVFAFRAGFGMGPRSGVDPVSPAATGSGSIVLPTPRAVEVADAAEAPRLPVIATERDEADTTIVVATADVDVTPDEPRAERRPDERVETPEEPEDTVQEPDARPDEWPRDQPLAPATDSYEPDDESKEDDKRDRDEGSGRGLGHDKHSHNGSGQGHDRHGDEASDDDRVRDDKQTREQDDDVPDGHDEAPGRSPDHGRSEEVDGTAPAANEDDDADDPSSEGNGEGDDPNQDDESKDEAESD